MSPRLTRIEWAPLEATRPRHAGSNARLGDHGLKVRVPFARLTTEDGVTGFGRVGITSPEQAASLLARPLADLFSGDPDRPAVPDQWRTWEFPLWDLAAKRAGVPVYAFTAGAAVVPHPLTVPCYDTSLYFDDLHLADTTEAAELIVGEARDGFERGHRAFKIKVGRGGRHMPLEEGTRRDIAIIRAVRRAVGPEPPLMLDANNGWNLNLAKRVLEETAECGIFWLEEAFHEDAVLYQDLKNWLSARNLSTLIADGEGAAHPKLLDWARDGLVDVIQYDVFSYGFSRWLALGRQLDAWNVRSAPHHYGAMYGNFVSGHLAAVVSGFTFIEWDEAACPELDTSAYEVREGRVTLPSLPGFGLHLDEDRFTYHVREAGFRLEIE